MWPIVTPATRTTYFDRDTCLPMNSALMSRNFLCKDPIFFKYNAKSRLNDRKMNFLQTLLKKDIMNMVGKYYFENSSSIQTRRVFPRAVSLTNVLVFALSAQLN